MRIRRIYNTALAFSAAAVLLAVAALMKPKWHAVGPISVEPAAAEIPRRETTPPIDAERLEKLAAQLAELAARLATLEKSVSADPQVDLLTEINAALQATAKIGSKNAADLAAIERRFRDLTSSTQAAFNTVGQELGNMQLVLVKEVERRKQAEFDAKASTR